MAEKAKSTLLDADDLRPIIKFVGKNWILMIIIPTIAYAIAYYFTHKMADIYAAKTEILLKSAETYEYQQQIYKEVGYYQAYNDITNQKRILASYDLVNKALEKLPFNVSYYLVGRVRVKKVDRFEAFTVWADYDRFNRLLLNQPFNVKILDMDHYSISFDFNGAVQTKTYPFGELVEDVNYVIRLERNKFFNEETFESIKKQDFQFRIHHPDYLVKKYKNNLKIEQVEFTSILTLTLMDELPSRAKMFLDTLSRAYIDYTLESQIEVNENTQRYIDKQLSELNIILDSLEAEMELYKQQKGILDLSREQIEYFNTLIELEKEKRQVEFRIGSVDDILSYVNNHNAYEDKLLPPAIYVFEDDAFLNQNLNKLYDLHLRRTSELRDYTPENLAVQKTDSLIFNLSRNVVNYLNNSRKAMVNRIGDLNGEIRRYESMVKGIPKSMRDVLSIERMLKVNEGLFVFLLEKKANTVIARAAIIPQTSIIETARSVGVVGPNRENTHYTAIGIGLLISFIVGLIRLLFFERIENLKELRAISKLPVIGALPNYAGAESDPMVTEVAPRSNVSEAFRALRTNLQYLLPGESSRVILITSLHPGEGKTFTSTNISSIFAKAGKKVIIFDFDMHKPKVHKNFGIENIIGVSTILIGKNTLEECTVPSNIPNLDVVTAGPPPPNASELVMGQDVERLLDKAKEKYDYVIIDTPPLMLISDSLVLLKLADTGIFVMNTEKATKQGVQHIENILDLNNLNKVSLILNNVKRQKWKYYYGKYAYKYGYGYGYGYAYGVGYGYGYGYGYGQGEDGYGSYGEYGDYGGYGYGGYGGRSRKRRKKKPSGGKDNGNLPPAS
jgi:capsular exopolysaccharide synthesis family protein